MDADSKRYATERINRWMEHGKLFITDNICSVTHPNYPDTIKTMLRNQLAQFTIINKRPKHSYNGKTIITGKGDDGKTNDDIAMAFINNVIGHFKCKHNTGIQRMY